MFSEQIPFVSLLHLGYVYKPWLKATCSPTLAGLEESLISKIGTSEGLSTAWQPHSLHAVTLGEGGGLCSEPSSRTTLLLGTCPKLSHPFGSHDLIFLAFRFFCIVTLGEINK